MQKSKCQEMAYYTDEGDMQKLPESNDDIPIDEFDGITAKELSSRLKVGLSWIYDMRRMYPDFPCHRNTNRYRKSAQILFHEKAVRQWMTKKSAGK